MKQRASSVIMSLTVQFGALKTRELQELLEDDDKIDHIIRRSDKLQGLHGAVERMLLSNEKLAKAGLSQKPHFRDAKLLLAMKYKEVERLRSIIQAKREQLEEKYSMHYAQLCLMKKTNQAEEECELLFQRFVSGKTPLADFLDSFLFSRKLQNIRLILVKKLQDMTELQPTRRLSEIHPDTQRFSAGFPEQVHNGCLPLCSLTTALVLPACCHPPRLLLPFGSPVNTVQILQDLPFCHDHNKPLHAGIHGRGPGWPTRPVRLQPLKLQQRRHQQAPQ